MLLATYEPGQEMAFANFFLAIFCLFTITIPLLLITRGNKTEANRDFITATINPWSQIANQIEVMPVVISGITPTSALPQQPEYIHESKDETISKSESIISIDTKRSRSLDESSSQGLETNAEALVA